MNRARLDRASKARSTQCKVTNGKDLTIESDYILPNQTIQFDAGQ